MNTEEWTHALNFGIAIFSILQIFRTLRLTKAHFKMRGEVFNNPADRFTEQSAKFVTLEKFMLLDETQVAFHRRVLNVSNSIKREFSDKCEYDRMYKIILKDTLIPSYSCSSFSSIPLKSECIILISETHMWICLALMKLR